MKRTTRARIAAASSVAVRLSLGLRLGLGLGLGAASLPIATVATGCSKPPPPAPDEATLRADDKRELERLVAIDVRASQAMREADETSTKPDAGARTTAAMDRATAAVDEGLRATEAASMKTAWGTTKKSELLAILRDRKAEMPKYRAAIEGTDPEQMIPVITAQAAIERRALALVASVTEAR